MPRPLPRFRLAVLLGSMLLAALCFGIAAKSGPTYYLTIRCDVLPPNAWRLVQWLKENWGADRIRVARGCHAVYVAFSSRPGSRGVPPDLLDRYSGEKRLLTSHLVCGVDWDDLGYGNFHHLSLTKNHRPASFPESDWRRAGP